MDELQQGNEPHPSDELREYLDADPYYLLWIASIEERNYGQRNSDGSRLIIGRSAEGKD
jgi:hypothetical protein